MNTYLFAKGVNVGTDSSTEKYSLLRDDRERSSEVGETQCRDIDYVGASYRLALADLL
jgi:hypothetical protein